MASRPLLTTSQPSLKLLTTKYWPTLMSNFVVIILRMHRWWTCLWIILVCKQAAQTRETLRGTQFGLHSYALLITWNHLLSWPFFWQFDSHFYSTIHHICEAANRAWLKIAWWYILFVSRDYVFTKPSFWSHAFVALGCTIHLSYTMLPINQNIMDTIPKFKPDKWIWVALLCSYLRRNLDDHSIVLKL